MRISDWSSDVCSSDLIPQIAVKMADSGASVFVVDKKGHAVPRSIRLGEMQGDKWVVLEGLRPGEKIVTNGVQKEMAGQPVRVAGRPSARAPQTKRSDRFPLARFCVDRPGCTWWIALVFDSSALLSFRGTPCHTEQ